MYMESKEAKKFGFINKNALDLMKTLEDFKYPPPNKANLFSVFFPSKKFDNSKPEIHFKRWYRYFYRQLIVHCYLPQFLQSLPQFKICDIMGYHFLYFFDQYISLKFEEKYAKTGDPGVKIVAVLFKKYIQYSRDIKSISKRQVKRHPLRGEGENVLADNYSEFWSSLTIIDHNF